MNEQSIGSRINTMLDKGLSPIHQISFEFLGPRIEFPQVSVEIELQAARRLRPAHDLIDLSRDRHGDFPDAIDVILVTGFSHEG
jgi:hypothetical protein